MSPPQSDTEECRGDDTRPIYSISMIMMRTHSREIIITTRGEEGSPAQPNTHTHIHTQRRRKSESGDPFRLSVQEGETERHHHSSVHNIHAISDVLVFLHYASRSSTLATACVAFHSQRFKRNALSLSLLRDGTRRCIHTQREREREGQMRDAPHVQQPRHFV